MFWRWFSLFLILVFCFVGLQIYRNTALMDRGYLLQKLKARKDDLIERNGYLKEQLTSRLSLSTLEDYARKKLGLVNPQKVRFLKQNFSPPKESPSPSPDEGNSEAQTAGLGSQIVRKIQQIKQWFTVKDNEEKK